MSGSYSDAELALTAQIAYLDCYEGETVGDVIKRVRSNYENQTGLDATQQRQLEVVHQLEDIASENGISGYDQWKVVAVHDDNDNTGFYGCMIETGNDDAVLSFRGTETVDMDHVIDDGIADFGLLNSTETRQQAMAAEFANDMYQKYGDEYDAYYVTGHSLGGNLAEHATIYAPEGMKIERCVSYDGPGFSNEYIMLNADRIAARGGVIDQYQYSFVGSLLFPLPGTNYMVIDARNEGFARHSLGSINFTGGSVSHGSPDALSLVLGPLSKELELTPSTDPAFLIEIMKKGLFSNVELSVLYTIFSYIYGNGIFEFFENSGIVEFFSDVGEWFHSLFNGFGGPQFGEFEVNTALLNSFSTELNRLSAQIDSSSAAISEICDNLRYQSLAGNYLKSLTKRVCNNLRNDSGKALRLADAVGDCAVYFERCDKEVEAQFSAVARL